MVDEIVKQLVKDAEPFQERNNFSVVPGVYALFFKGKLFPLKNCQPTKNQIIFIGKTEGSLEDLDSEKPTASDISGNAVLRMTLGALLIEQLGLQPVPRSQKDIAKKKHNYYKFDPTSEQQLTDWMINNLEVSFYAYPKNKIEIDMLETELIRNLIPVLNTDRKNPDNIFRSGILESRKEAGEIAYTNRV